PSPSAAAQNTVAPRRRRAFSSSEIRPIHSTFGTSRRRSSPVSGPSPATQSTASRSRSENASSRTPRPLRGSWRPTKRMVGRAAAQGVALANWGTSTPVGTTSKSPPKNFWACSAASSEAAVVIVNRLSHRLSGGRDALYHGVTRPVYDAWNVPASGPSAPRPGGWGGAGGGGRGGGGARGGRAP